MTCRTWENRCKRSSAASPGKVRIEGGNEAKRSTVELRSLAVGFCGRIKGCPEFMRSKGRPSILRNVDRFVRKPLATREVLFPRSPFRARVRIADDPPGIHLSVGFQQVRLRL